MLRNMGQEVSKMKFLTAKPMANKKAAKECWDQIGSVILGRGQAVTDDSITYRDGMTAEDIIAMANKKVKKARDA